jgi:hypothetical protein
VGTEDFNLHNVFCVREDSDDYEIHKDDTPVYIPMAHSKDSFLSGTLFSTLWARASNELEKCDEIHFIGYGFPETDLNNLLYFLDYKEKIKTVVVYKIPDVACRRLSRIFSQNVVVTSDAKTFINERIISLVGNP